MRGKGQYQFSRRFSRREELGGKEKSGLLLFHGLCAQTPVAQIGGTGTQNPYRLPEPAGVIGTGNAGIPGKKAGQKGLVFASGGIDLQDEGVFSAEIRGEVKITAQEVTFGTAKGKPV